MSRGSGSGGIFFLQRLPGGLKDVAGAGVEENEVDGFERGFAFQMLERLRQHDFRALVHRKAGDAGADGGKGDGLEVALSGKAEGVGGGGAQSFRGGTHAAKAHAGGVDDMAGFELSAARDGGVADGDAADFVARALDGFAAFAGYGAGDAST